MRQRDSASSRPTTAARTSSCTTRPSRWTATASSRRASGCSSTLAPAPRARRPTMSARSEAVAAKREAEPVADTTERDAQALALRGEGRSFAHVARALGFEKSRDANLAFNRALRRLPAKARTKVRKEEGQRLDALAAKAKASE